MVEQARPPLSLLAALACCVGLPSGCALEPKTRGDEAYKLVKSLRAENAQLKDSTLSLKVQNQDLSQRAVDDGRSLRELEAANGQYERSIQGYQEEREQLKAAFDGLRSQVRTASGP